MGGYVTVPERRSRSQGSREEGEQWVAVPSGLYADRVKSVLTSNFRSVLGPGIVHEPLDSVQ